MRANWILAALLLFPAIATAGEAEALKMTAAQIEQRGKRLRAEVERIYQEKKASQALKPMGVGRNFITDDVVKYIPPGISFDDAEAILRAAGCDVSPRPYGAQRQALSYEDDVLAQFKLAPRIVLLPVPVTKFVVSLVPQAVGDYSSVDKLTAEIEIIGP